MFGGGGGDEHHLSQDSSKETVSEQKSKFQEIVDVKHPQILRSMRLCTTAAAIGASGRWILPCTHFLPAAVR
jgi:hypothetical protein